MTLRCAIQTCGAQAAEVVAHPGRGEPATPLCDYHAAVVHRRLDAEVVASAV